MRTLTKALQENILPKQAHIILKEGNLRFVKNLKAQRNLNEQVIATSNGQYPFAVILSCIDSRVPAELVFDQGIGDIFSIRIAGNVINKDILASMEYGCQVVGAKIIVVMGHNKCGAVISACNGFKMGNITSLLNKIKPSVDKVIINNGTISKKAIEKVSRLNVKHAIQKIRSESRILNALEKSGKIEIAGAMYSVNTGKVTFFDKDKSI